jgi:hypothetical protein
MFVLVAVALIGIVVSIYIVISSTPFFPKSLQAESGNCPANSYAAAERGPVMDEFTANWYSGELLAFGERPIFQDKARSQRAVRFTLLRSNHAHVMIRTVETEDGHVRLIGKWMPGRDGCDETKPGCSVDRILTATEQARLSAAQSPQLRKASYGCPSGVDGSVWILESSGRGDYQFWSEWSPLRGDLRELGLVMLDLTGWRLQDIY